MWHVYRQITGLQRYQTVVLTHRRENAEQFPFANVITIPKAKTRFFRRLWCKQICNAPQQIYRGEALRIFNALDEAGAELLHIYFGHIGVYLLPLISIWPRPTVVSFHGADAGVDMHHQAHRQAMVELFQSVDAVLARSQSLLNALRALGCPEDKLFLQRTGIPLSQWKFSERSWPSDGQWHIVQASRLIPKKGLKSTLRTFALFSNEHPGSRLTLAGEGPLRGELLALASQLGLEKQVSLPGFLTQKQLQNLYSTAHLFIHPSEMSGDGNQEGVPNSMLEAMATGLPVVATLHGGVPEAVEDGLSGLLLPEGDVEGLYNALLRFAQDQDFYKCAAKSAAQSVRERFAQNQQVQVLEACYARLLAGKR